MRSTMLLITVNSFVIYIQYLSDLERTQSSGLVFVVMSLNQSENVASFQSSLVANLGAEDTIEWYSIQTMPERTTRHLVSHISYTGILMMISMWSQCQGNKHCLS